MSNISNMDYYGETFVNSYWYMHDVLKSVLDDMIEDMNF